MVFTTPARLGRIAMHASQFFSREQIGPDRFWGRRKIKMMTAHFYGRSRNCYKLAVRYNTRALKQAGEARQARKKDVQDLWDCRVEGVANTLNYNRYSCEMSIARPGQWT